MRLSAPVAPVAAGGELVVTAEAIPSGALYVDLYAADGSVVHLRRGTVPDAPAATDVTTTAAASGTPGQRLVVAITTPALLNLGQRPATESETAYLPALQHELARLKASAFDPRAEVATLSIIAASRPIAISSRPPLPASTAGRAPNPSDPRCQNIVERVTLGATLSDADRVILRTSCGR